MAQHAWVLLMLSVLLLGCGSGEDSEHTLDSPTRSGDATSLTLVSFPDVGLDANPADGGVPSVDAGSGQDVLVDGGADLAIDALQDDAQASQTDTILPDVSLPDVAPPEPNREALNALHRALLWRDTDLAGLTVFLPRVVQHGRDGLKTVASNIARSAEYLELKAAKTPSERLNQLYRGLFGREPDPSGQASYLDLIEAGRDLTVAQVMIDSIEFRELFPALE